MRRLIIALSLTIALFGPVSIARAEGGIPHLINLQSLVFDEDGNLTKSDFVDLTIRILDEENNILYTEEIENVPVVEGAIQVAIGERSSTGSIPLEALDPTSGLKFLDVTVNGTNPFELMPLQAVPYAMWAEKALTVADDSIESRHIKDGSVKLEDLEPGLAFSNLQGQASEGQIPNSIARGTDLQNHLTSGTAHPASAITVAGPFVNFTAFNVEEAIGKIDRKLVEEIVNRQGGQGGLTGDLGAHAAATVAHGSDGTVVGLNTLTNSIAAHAALTQGVHGLSTVPGNAVVGTTDTQTLENKTLESPTINTPSVTGGTFASPTLITPTLTGAGAGVATLQYANSADGRTFTIPDPGASDDLVTATATQTLSNKTLDSSTINNAAINGGTFSGSLSDTTGNHMGTVEGVDVGDLSSSVSSHTAATTAHGSDGAIVGINTLNAHRDASIGTAHPNGAFPISRLDTDVATQGELDGHIGTAIATAHPSGAFPIARLDTDIATQGELDGAISSEASTRASADSSLQSQITSEGSTRASADTSLQSQIDGKVAKSGDTMSGTLTMSGADITMSAGRTVDGVDVSALEGRVSTNEGRITNHEGRITALEGGPDFSQISGQIAPSQVPQYMRPAAFGTVTRSGLSGSLSNGYNVSSVSDEVFGCVGGRQLRVNFTSSLPDAGYVALASNSPIVSKAAASVIICLSTTGGTVSEIVIFHP